MLIYRRLHGKVFDFVSRSGWCDGAGTEKGGVQRGRPRLVGHLAQAFVQTSSYSMCVKL